MTYRPPVVAVVRSAALPLVEFARAGRPELFDAVRTWDRDHGRLAGATRNLAQVIGETLVPHGDLSPAGRASVLSVRRCLHALPDPVPSDLAAAVAEAAVLAARLDAPALADQLDRAAGELRDLIARHDALDDLVAAEHRRLLELPWSIVDADPVARRAVEDANPGTLTEIVTRLRAGESWHTKRMRQRSDYLWRMITRGATRATPRGWLAHVGLLTTDPNLAPGPPPELTIDYAVEYAANRHDGTGLADLCTPDGLLGVTPLYQELGSHTTFWVIDPHDPARMRELRLRRTDALRAVQRALAGGTLTPAQLSAALIPPSTSAEVRARQESVLRAFVEHLVGLGVVTVSRPATSTVTEWLPRVGDVPRPPAGAYVDVHRRADRPMSLATGRRIEQLVRSAMRVLDVIDVEPIPDLTRGLTDQPQPVLDLLAVDLATVEQSSTHRHDWPVPTGQHTPYARLHAWLSSRLDGGPIDLDDDTLAAAGVGAVSARPLSWPVDCVVRPVWQDGGPLVLLDQIQSTGTLDSRIADALGAIHPAGTARVDWYRRFLQLVERDLGGRFVELLVPSLSDRAANAVRRPAYTSAWTGDPDVGRYHVDGPNRPSTYLPLSELTVRSEDDHPVVEVRGRRIWPVYHATRVMPPPWHLVGARLLNTGPRIHRQHWRALHYSLTAWPDRSAMPRLTVGGGQLVLTAAQWRLPVECLWAEGADLATAARTVARLRADRGFPRWVTVAADPHDDPRACDLDSVHAVRLLDRVRRGGARELLLVEMLPAPDTPGGPANHTELVTRLPLELDPAEMAALTVAEQRRRSPVG